MKNEHISNAQLGAHLKSAREAANLSLIDVARRLRLKPEIIQAIETDNYNNTPKPVFIRGYLRAYAKLVDVPADTVITVFNNYYSSDNQHIKVSIEKEKKQSVKTAPKSLATPPKPTLSTPKSVAMKKIRDLDVTVRSLKDRSVRWVSYIVGGSLVLLVALWWIGHHVYTLNNSEESYIGMEPFNPAFSVVYNGDIFSQPANEVTGLGLLTQKPVHIPFASPQMMEQLRVAQQENKQS